MSLNSMLKECLAEIPSSLQATTPIALKATAGLRLLPSGQADNILNEVSVLLGTLKFDPSLSSY